MKLATFLSDKYKEEKWGLVIEHPIRKEKWVFPVAECEEVFRRSATNKTNGMFRSLPYFIPEGRWPATLKEFLELEEDGMERLRALERYLVRFIEQSDAFAIECIGQPLSSVKLCSPIPRPRLMWGLVQNSPSFWRKDPKRKIANFIPQGHQRPIGSTIGDMDIWRNATGFNVELGFVIGKKGKNIPIEDALKYVAGYIVVIDGQITRYFDGFCEEGESYTQMLERNSWYTAGTCSWGGKKSDAHCVAGPYIVTPDEIGNVYDLLVYTMQDNIVRDRSHTAGLSIGIERTIQFYSSFATLYPGDIIHMGTVGTDGLYVTAGMFSGAHSLIQAEIEKIGRISARVLDVDGFKTFGESEGLEVKNNNDVSVDWRDECEKKQPLSPAVRWYKSHGLEELDGIWAPDKANHVFTCFGNYKDSEKVENIKRTRVPCFFNGPNSMIAQSGNITRLAKRATTLDVGVELGFVVKKLASEIKVKEADEYILGYVPVISISDRSFDENIIEPATPQERGICQIYARWGDGYNIVGQPGNRPEDDAEMRLYVEGFDVLSQQVSQYRHKAAETLAFISCGITLFPGDVVLLGRTSERIVLTPEQYENGVKVRALIEGLNEINSYIVRE